MTDSPAQNSLELEVKNFGPIVEAKIDLRPLTVFVGPSNTGKSYLAILIYALHRFFSGSTQFVSRPGFLDYHMARYKELPEEALEHFAAWVVNTFADRSELPDKKNILLSGTVADLTRSFFTESDIRNGDLANGISRCFGVNGTKALIRKRSQGGAQVVLRKCVPEDSEPIAHKLTIGTRKTALTTTIPEKTPTRINFSYFHSRFSGLLYSGFKDLLRSDKKIRRESELIAANDLIGALTTSILPSLAAPLHLPAFYLPADRTGIMHAHIALTSALIRGAPMAGLRQPSPTPLLSGVLADFLEQLINLDTQPQDLKHERSDLGSKIEKAILNGTVDIQRSESGYPRFTYRQEGWKDDLPLMNASSMVSELAPVVLYLRHVVRPGNVLIVEEPESHLHPAMQVEFTRQLAALVRAGVRVIITTHSEWVLEELANIVRLSGLSKAERKGIKGGDVSLRPEEVGAWLFQPKNRPRGSVVKEIPLDDDSGLFPSGFDEVAVALHNNWAEISSRDRGGANG